MPTVAEALNQAVALHQAGQISKAASIYLRILRVDPGCADAWHLAGLAAYQAGRLEDAAGWIQKAIGLRADVAVYHSNLAAVYKALKRLDEAANCCRRAIELDPQSVDAYNNLANILSDQGQNEQAVDCYRKALALRPQFAECWANLGNSLRELNRMEEAIEAYRQSLEHHPDLVSALAGLGLALRQQGELQEAEQCFQRVIELAPDLPDGWAGMARICAATARWEQAQAAIAKGMAVAPQSPALHLAAAECEKHQGRCEGAIERLEQLRGRLDPNCLHMQEVLFALGSLYDRVGKTELAFSLFCEANRLKMERSPNWYLDKERALAGLETLLDVFRPEWIASWTSPNVPIETPCPIFLVGFPRSGTTLLDVILDSHPRIDVLEETSAAAAMGRVIRDLPGGYPLSLARLTEAHIRQMRYAYFEEASRHVRPSDGRIILDKHPMNTSRIGLIHRAFPKAKIIFAARHPCDVCLSCFMRDFAYVHGAMASFFTMIDTAWLYARTMDVWHQFAAVLPLDYCLVRYEDLLDDLTGQAQRLLDFLGLEWHEGIQRYAENAKETRKRRTPNFAQITQPIYTTSRYRWQKYRKYMEPILPILEPYVRYFGYSLEE